MSTQFVIYDVSAELIMNISKLVASSPHPLSKEDITRSFTKNEAQIKRGINQCVQLGLINIKDELYISNDRYRDLIKRAEKTQLYIPLRQALQNYPPFLLYLDFISKGYSSEEAAKMTTGIFKLSDSMIIEKTLRNFGLNTGIIIIESGKLSIPESEKGIPTDYINSLVKAMNADVNTKLFLIETMGESAFVYLTEKGITIEDLAEALVKYESDAKTSINKATQTFEHFLYKLGEDVGADVKICNGPIEYVDKIKSTTGNNVLLKNQSHISHGLGGLRNMAHHSPEKETGKEWQFTPQGAIIASLLVPTLIRSIYLYWRERKQEF
jgi:hypothetical protein